MLRLTNVKKVYKTTGSEVHALKGVTLNFRQNEFVSILGPSGCGKTTLLNIIGGLDHYTDGDLTIKGVSTKRYKDKDWDVYRNHRIGFVFQNYNLIPHQTVLGNVELSLTISGVSKKERRQRAVEALKRVGLEKELKKKPNQLSGGQMQRVAIARALVNNPEILLADEPTGALDTKTSVQIMDLMREVAGERLVIMVTHNPELAENYSTRIIRLQDGLVVSDSNPYEGDDKREKLLEKLQERGLTTKDINEWKKQKDKKGGAEKASMSYATALGLSGRNLRAKGGRTALTSIAGSIGIIGVSLVLALSSGFNAYIAKTEADMLSNYPLTIQETTYSTASIMQSLQGGMPGLNKDKLYDHVYINSFLTKLSKNMVVKNTITQEYVDYIKEMDEDAYYAIKYDYGGKVVNNIYTDLEYGGYQLDTSLNTMVDFYTDMLTYDPSLIQYSMMAGAIGGLDSVVNEVPSAREYILSQYDVYDASGKNPDAYPEDTAEDELVLVINNDGGMSDIMLMQLGLISIDDFISFSKSEKDDVKYINYQELLGKTYTYYPNDALYIEKDGAGTDTWFYKGYSTSAMPTLNKANGIPLKIACILRAKPEVNYGCLQAGLGYMNGFAQKYYEDSRASKIVQRMTSQSVNKLNVSRAYMYKMLTTSDLTATKPGDVYLREAGGATVPNFISIYARDFSGKDKVTAHLDAWNERYENDETKKIEYTDTVEILMGIIRTMLDAVTYVLVAFTGISLIVSSVMIAVITLVSVVERTKEIGVLRALGARKKDIRRLFNAETFLIGLLSGAIGVGFTYLVSIPINLLLGSLTGIGTLAALPWWQGGIMVIISVLLNLISGLIPANGAAKKDPVIALRSE